MPNTPLNQTHSDTSHVSPEMTRSPHQNGSGELFGIPTFILGRWVFGRWVFGNWVLLALHQHTLATAHLSALKCRQATKFERRVIRNISKGHDGHLKWAKLTIENACLGIWICMPWSGGIFTDLCFKAAKRSQPWAFASAHVSGSCCWN